MKAFSTLAIVYDKAVQEKFDHDRRPLRHDFSCLP